MCKANQRPGIVLVSSAFHLKSREERGEVCHPCVKLLFSAALFLASLVWKDGSLHEGVCRSVLRRFSFISFFSHLLDYAVMFSDPPGPRPHWAREPHFHESWLITSAAELGDSMEGPWLPQHLSGNYLCWMLSGWGLPQRWRWFLFAKGGRQEEEE